MTDKITPLIELIKLVKTLRGKNGCPWDKKQTPQTMSVYLIEEMYELIDAINSKEPDAVLEELGDVLFLILFIASQYEEAGHFDIADAASANKEKMIKRHPHVFGNKKADSIDDIKRRWQKIKMKEKNHANYTSVLDSVPNGLPALIRAYRISERAAKTGFDWNNLSDVMVKAEEELNELKIELTDNSTGNSNNNAAMEFGDTIFTLVNIARFANIHPETALTDSIKKFEKRFKYMENGAQKRGVNLESLSIDEMNMLWEEAKKNISSKSFV